MQRSIFDPPHNGVATSVAAATSVRPSVDTMRGQVLGFIRAKGGATDEQIQDGLKMNPSTQRPRRLELQQAGLIVDSGHKAKTKSGRQAVVWIEKP